MVLCLIGIPERGADEWSCTTVLPLAAGNPDCWTTSAKGAGQGMKFGSGVEPGPARAGHHQRSPRLLRPNRGNGREAGQGCGNEPGHFHAGNRTRSNSRCFRPILGEVIVSFRPCGERLRVHLPEGYGATQERNIRRVAEGSRKPGSRAELPATRHLHRDAQGTAPTGKAKPPRCAGAFCSWVYRRRVWIQLARSLIFTRSCFRVSRSRTVTVSTRLGSSPLPTVSKSTVTQKGVPTSSWRR